MALIENRKARFDYETLETFEAGLELRGFEVKSLRSGQGSLDGAYVIVRGNEAFLVNMRIPPYQVGNEPKEYEQDRTRRLLLSRSEIVRLSDAEKQKGLTIVPFSVYNKKRTLKVEIRIVRGKKKHDKRQTLKKRESERDIQRTLKGE